MTITAACEIQGPDPGCYGCRGTGRILWAGIPADPCRCTRWCLTHDRYCGDDE